MILKASLQYVKAWFLILNRVYIVWDVTFNQTEWLVACKICQSARQTVYNAKRHSTTGKHLEKVSSFYRRSSSSNSAAPNAILEPAVPFSSPADVITTRLLQALSDSSSEREPLPPIDSFPEYSEDQYEPIRRLDWTEIDALNPEFSGSREAESIHTLNDYMLHMYQYGPDNIDSEDDEGPPVPSDSDSDTDSLWNRGKYIHKSLY